MCFCEFLRVKLDELRFVLDVHEDAAFTVGHGELWLAAQSERARHRAVRGVNRGCVLAPAVHGEDALGNLVVDDGVGVGIGLYRAESLERFEIKYDSLIGATGADEPAVKVGGERYAMHSGGVRNFALDGVPIGVHDYNMRPMRNVHSASMRIDGQVIPEFVAGYGNRFDQMIA